MAAMSAKPRLSARRLLITLALGTLGIAATLYAIYELSIAATRPELAAPHYGQMLIITLSGLSLLMAAALWQTLRLIGRLRRHTSGARLSLSFALRLLITALIPVGIIGGFAWMFLSYDLGKTFNSQVTVALQDSLQLTRTAITMRARTALDQTRGIADAMTDMNYADLVSDIEAIRRQAGALELAVFDRQGNLVAFANQNLSTLTVAPPSAAAYQRVQQDQETFEFGSQDDNYTIKVLADIAKPGRDHYYLQAIYTMPEAFNTLADSVRESYQQHQSYNYLQPHITTSLVLILGLIIIFTLLIALWISIGFGEAMTQPVHQLIEATKKVISGDFSTPITDMPRNDLGTLGDNFNAMLLTLRDAENMNHQIQDQLTDQNTFLATVLDNITAGVITFDWHGRLQTINHAAEQILDTNTRPYHGQKPPRADAEPQNSYEELMISLAPALSQNSGSWRQEATLSRYGQRKTLICHGAPLPGQNSKNRGGQIIVFEDVTEFQQNQRNAAWEEVARRLAHEIKNPLTPIRLQSERLQRKLTGKLADPQDEKVLERAATTIINQVDAMQQMVSDFSQYAKPLELRRHPLNLNALLAEIAELYPDNPLELDLDADLPAIPADAVQLRQVIHNLTKNAIEAASPDSAPIHILWQTRRDGANIALSIEDSGGGFADLSKDPFEPYVTNKSKGTGLGLAIVKKIITEHHGSIRAGHGKTLRGARIAMTLPIKTN